MKRNERTTYNQLKKTVTNDTLYVEIPTNWTHEARQAIHELLTIEKGMYASCIGPEVVTGAECVRYTKATEYTKNTRREQENADIDTVSANLARTEYAWNGYKPTTKDTNAEEREEGENMNTIETMKQELNKRKDRSAWNKGVNEYALELVEELEEAINGGWFDAEDIAAPKLLELQLLNGARSWKEYSWGGCALIYDQDIAERLCNPSELKRTHGGHRRPNASEQWLDTQARALFQASQRVKEAAKHATQANA